MNIFISKLTLNVNLSGVQITSNNSGCVPVIGSSVEPTLSHVILQLMIVSIMGAKHQVGVPPQN